MVGALAAIIHPHDERRRRILDSSRGHRVVDNLAVDNGASRVRGRKDAAPRGTRMKSESSPLVFTQAAICTLLVMPTESESICCGLQRWAKRPRRRIRGSGRWCA